MSRWALVRAPSAAKMSAAPSRPTVDASSIVCSSGSARIERLPLVGKYASFTSSSTLARSSPGSRERTCEAARSRSRTSDEKASSRRLPVREEAESAMAVPSKGTLGEARWPLRQDRKLEKHQE
jgi:hypothetical protein